MLVVTRHTVAEDGAAAFLDRAQVALAAFAGCAGHLRGRVGRATDDPTLWVITTEWASVGAYRRALSSYAVKVDAVPVMYSAHDEPSAFEVLAEQASEPAADGAQSAVRRSRRAADAGTVGVGEASGPDVPPSVGGAGSR